MPADLRELLDRTAAEPTVPADPTAIRARSRRRTWRRRGGAGATTVVLVALLATVAWPGGAPLGVLIEDRVADRPEDTATAIDLPDGWRAVEVGNAMFGLPPEMATVDVGREDTIPCRNMVDEPTAFVAATSYPARPDACRLRLGAAPTVLAASLSTVPRHATEPDEGPWEWGVAPHSGPLSDLDPSVEVRVPPGDPRLQRVFRFPDLDLYLEFSGEDTYDRAILATVTAREETDAAAATEEDRGGATSPDDRAAGGEPFGSWRLVEGRGPEGAVRPMVDRPVTLEVASGVPRIVDDVDPDRFDGLTGTWSGDDGCGPYELLVTVEGHEITVSDEGSFVSYNLCHGDEQRSRTTYLAALRSVEHLDTERHEVEDGDRLVLTGPDTRLVFAPTALP